MATFIEKLQAKWDEGKFVCVGLDSDATKIPESVKTWGAMDRVEVFNRAIIDATRDIVCAYKPNAGFYEALADDAYRVLRGTSDYLQEVAPDVPVIYDAKRGDIGNTNLGYVHAAFESFRADAVTVHPYLGMEAMKPFLDRSDRGVIVLCRTSNPGAGEFQDLPVSITHAEAEELGLCGHPDDGVGMTWATSAPVYLKVAHRVATAWNYNGNCSVVAGATYPTELAEVRRVVGDLPILIPGIGAQKADLEATVNAGADSKGQGMIINNSRVVIFASSGEDYAEAARAAALDMHQKIAAVLSAA
jgi:orotidine-5'-phosphate decarboxylase